VYWSWIRDKPPKVTGLVAGLFPFQGPDQSAFALKSVLADAALGEPCIFNYSENETNFASIFFFRMCGLTVDQPLYFDDPIDLLFAVQTIITQKSAAHRQRPSSDRANRDFATRCGWAKSGTALTLSVGFRPNQSLREAKRGSFF
jgi:hypothetical protein